jgi:hypothetical protein
MNIVYINTILGLLICYNITIIDTDNKNVKGLLNIFILLSIMIILTLYYHYQEIHRRIELSEKHKNVKNRQFSIQSFKETIEAIKDR